MKEFEVIVETIVDWEDNGRWRVEAMCVESFYNLFCCEKENNIGAITGGDYWVRGVLFLFFFKLNDNKIALKKRNYPAGKNIWSSEERRDN